MIASRALERPTDDGWLFDWDDIDTRWTAVMMLLSKVGDWTERERPEIADWLDASTPGRFLLKEHRPNPTNDDILVDIFFERAEDAALFKLFFGSVNV